VLNLDLVLGKIAASLKFYRTEELVSLHSNGLFLQSLWCRAVLCKARGIVTLPRHDHW
jgi:hypothetical protein